MRPAVRGNSVAGAKAENSWIQQTKMIIFIIAKELLSQNSGLLCQVLLPETQVRQRTAAASFVQDLQHIRSPWSSQQHKSVMPEHAPMSSAAYVVQYGELLWTQLTRHDSMLLTGLVIVILTTMCCWQLPVGVLMRTPVLSALLVPNSKPALQLISL